MPRRAVLLSVLSALVLACATPLRGQVDWEPLRLERQRTAVVYFPGAYAEVSDTVATPLGELPFTTYYHQDDRARSGNRLYTLTIVDYADGAFPTDSTERRAAFFASTVEAAAESVGGRVLISQPLERGGRVGWTFRIDYGEEPESVVRNEAFLVGDRYYHLQVFALRPDEGERARRRFFESFTPLPRPGSADIGASPR